MQRTYIKDVEAGKTVFLKGWVHELRNLAKLKFLLVRDVTGIIQCIIKDEKLFEAYNQLTLESVVELEGTVKQAHVKAELARSDCELEVTKITLLSKAETLPIQVNEKTTTTELPTRLDHRALDLRKPKIAAIFKIQSEIAHSFREYFYKQGFLEIQAPCIIGAASEGGSELFEVQYFEKKACLAQSPQLYKQMLACGAEKVTTIMPVWRAEKHNTTRHINEIRQMDIEVAFADQFTVMKYIEEAVAYVVKNVKETCSRELDILGIKNLKVPKGIYLHYNEAIKQSGGILGEDFTSEQEKKLGALYPGDVVFTHSWPSSIKPFYIMPKDANSKQPESCGFDALYGGMEISSGGQRIHLPELLIQMIEKKGLNPEHFKDYINSFRYGSPPHAGWSIGLERLTQMICGLENIKEATMFPRDRDRITP